MHGNETPVSEKLYAMGEGVYADQVPEKLIELLNELEERRSSQQDLHRQMNADREQLTTLRASSARLGAWLETHVPRWTSDDPATAALDLLMMVQGAVQGLTPAVVRMWGSLVSVMQAAGLKLPG